MIGNWLGIIGGVVGLVVFLGAVTVYLRGSYDAGTIKTLKDSNAALHERVDVLEKSEDALLVRVTKAEAEVGRLMALRPSAEVLAAMDDFLHKHDETARQILEIVRGAER